MAVDLPYTGSYTLAQCDHHQHYEIYSGEKILDADGWTYYACYVCGHKWRSKTITEEL